MEADSQELAPRKRGANESPPVTRGPEDPRRHPRTHRMRTSSLPHDSKVDPKPYGMPDKTPTARDVP
jgi:hypothetical protein